MFSWWDVLTILLTIQWWIWRLAEYAHYGNISGNTQFSKCEPNPTNYLYQTVIGCFKFILLNFCQDFSAAQPLHYIIQGNGASHLIKFTVKVQSHSRHFRSEFCHCEKIVVFLVRKHSPRYVYYHVTTNMLGKLKVVKSNKNAQKAKELNKTVFWCSE